MKEAFKELGLDEKETAVYLAILELGQANVLDISRKAKVPRATVYGIIEKLITEDFISYIIKGKRRYYLAENPSKIIKKIKHKEHKINQIIPELQKRYFSSTSRPVIRYYEGAQGIIKMLDDILVTIPKGGTFEVILNVSDEFPILGDAYINHVEKRVDKGIWIRVIAERSEMTEKWPKEVKKYRRSFRFLPRGQHFSVSYHIYGNKVSMFSLQGPVVGVIIENKEIAEMERSQFEYMWKALK